MTEYKLEEIEKVISDLQKKEKKIFKKLTRFVKIREKLLCEKDSEYFNQFPTDLDKISDEQFEYLVAYPELMSQARYDFINKFWYQFGLNISGKLKNHQIHFTIHTSHFDENKDLQKYKQGLEIYFKYVKPFSLTFRSYEKPLERKVEGVTMDLIFSHSSDEFGWKVIYENETGKFYVLDDNRLKNSANSFEELVSIVQNTETNFVDNDDNDYYS